MDSRVAPDALPAGVSNYFIIGVVSVEAVYPDPVRRPKRLYVAR